LYVWPVRTVSMYLKKHVRDIPPPGIDGQEMSKLRRHDGQKDKHARMMMMMMMMMRVAYRTYVAVEEHRLSPRDRRVGRPRA
jgi:hypothetical protein